MRSIILRVPDKLAAQFVRLVGVYRQSGRPDPLRALLATLEAAAHREEKVEIIVRSRKQTGLQDAKKENGS